MFSSKTLFLAAVLALLAACGDVTPAASSGAAGDAPVTGEPLDGDEAGAPIVLGYRIGSKPVVGQPVGVEVEIETTLDDRPITLSYRSPESGSLAFPDSQPRSIEILPVAGAVLRPQQVTVIPQRDGRVYLTVSAAVETDTGSLQKSMSVPLEVERAPPSAAEDPEQ